MPQPPASVPASERRQSVRTGVVWVNTYRMGGHIIPFGGMKKSGIGREMGIDALNAYTEVKSVWIHHGE